MRAVGKRGAVMAACFLALLTPLAIPVGFSHAEEPGPTAAACPPSPAVLAGSIAPSPAAPASTSPSPSTDASPYQPSAEEVVACVGSQEINGATFAHWATVAENAEPRAHRRLDAEPTRQEMALTMGFLIATDWVIGEAANLHIGASAIEVRHRFDHLRHQQFPELAQFRKFMKRTGQTVSDLLLRVRLSMLTARIQRRVEGHGSAHARRRALTRFAKHFQRTWEAQTYCEAIYKVSDCGHAARSL
jgi:hypothetical protein